MIARLKTTVAVLLLLLVASSAQGQAQTEVPTQTNLAYGSAAPGTISAAGSTDSFTFSGAAGDLVFIRVLPLTNGLQTRAELVAPDGSTVRTSAADGSLTTRLNVNGGYFLKVTGQNGTGDFDVRLDAQTGISTALTSGQVTRAEFEVDAPPQLFHFQQSPDTETHLTVSADDPAFRFSTAVRDSSGKLIAFFSPQTRSAVLTVGAGDGVFDVTLTAADSSVTGLILIDLESDLLPATEPASVGATSQAPTGVVPTPGVPIVVTATPEGAVYCHISTNGTSNIRSAPTTSATILDHLTNNRSGDVIGTNADGTWYAVQLQGQIGWVAKQVAREVDPCPTLPVISPAG